MIEALAYLTIYGLPLLGLFGTFYFLYKYSYKYSTRKPTDAPAPLKELHVETPETQLASIIYGSYIKYVQDEFWHKKQFEWNFRKMQEWLKPKTKNRFTDRAILKVLSECQRLDKERREVINSKIREFPERYRNRAPQPPWVSINITDVRLAIETTLSPWTVNKIIESKDQLDIPPLANSEYRP